MRLNNIKRFLLGHIEVKDNNDGTTRFEIVYQPIEQKFSKTAKNIYTDGKITEEGEGLLKRCYMFMFYEYLDFEFTPDGLTIKSIRRVSKKEKIVVSPKFLNAKDIKVVSKAVVE